MLSNQHNAQHTAAVHYKHLRPSLRLLKFKPFSYLHICVPFKGYCRYIGFVVNWHVAIQISVEVSLSLKLLFYWREFY